MVDSEEVEEQAVDGHPVSLLDPSGERVKGQDAEGLASGLPG